MLTSLSFNIFGNILHRKQRKYKGGSRTPRSSMIELFVTMEVVSYWQSSPNLDYGGIVELPLYVTSVSMIKLESWRKTRELKHFIYWYLLSFLGTRNVIFASSAEKQLFFDRSICILAFLKSFIWINTLILEIFK